MAERDRLWAELNIQPTIDAFASSENAVCQRFFSKWPQIGSEGVNFFTQELRKEEVYFCCPPVKDAGHMIKRLGRFPGVTALVVVPAWEGSTYWSLLRDRQGGFIQEIQRHVTWEAACTDSGHGRSLFAFNNIRMWAGIYRKE